MKRLTKVVMMKDEADAHVDGETDDGGCTL